MLDEKSYLSHSSLLATFAIGQLTNLSKNNGLLDIISRKSVKKTRFSRPVNQKASSLVMDLQIHFFKAAAYSQSQSHQAERTKRGFLFFG